MVKKVLKTIMAYLLIIYCAFFMYYLFFEINKENDLYNQNLSDQYSSLETKLSGLENKITVLTMMNTSYKDQIKELLQQIEALRQEQTSLREKADIISRAGDRAEKTKKEVTAYDLTFSSCQKLPEDPDYGITASGARVKEWYTVASGKNIPFGTKVYIPFFKDKPNGGWFVVQDRGGGISDNDIDVFVNDHEECMEIGRRILDVWILKGDLV
jgi:3D (Asp-Asp-Asp) domain-containing protein/uncharacterized protein YxeA